MKQDDVFEIDDLKTMDVLNSPLRHRILASLSEPRSVSELARRLGLPTTRLYYHVNLLAKAGLIRVVETRKQRAMTEKVFQARARNVTAGSGLFEKGFDPVDLAKAGAGVVLDPARADAEAGLESQFRRLSSDGDTEAVHMALTRAIAFLTQSSVGRCIERLQELIEEFSDIDEEGGVEYGLSIVLFPVARGDEATS